MNVKYILFYSLTDVYIQMRTIIIIEAKLASFIINSLGFSHIIFDTIEIFRFSL